MAQAEYCDQCRRIVGVGCACNMSFRDKVASTKVEWASWSATRPTPRV